MVVKRQGLSQARTGSRSIAPPLISPPSPSPAPASPGPPRLQPPPPPPPLRPLPPPPLPGRRSRTPSPGLGSRSPGRQGRRRESPRRRLPCLGAGRGGPGPGVGHSAAAWAAVRRGASAGWERETIQKNAQWRWKACEMWSSGGARLAMRRLPVSARARRSGCPRRGCARDVRGRGRTRRAKGARPSTWGEGMGCCRT